MEKLSLRYVFVNPTEGYKLVDQSEPGFKLSGDGSYAALIIDKNTMQKLQRTFIVEHPDATVQVWFGRLKKLGIELSVDTPLEVDYEEVEEFSYWTSDGWVKVPKDQVIQEQKNPKNFYCLVDSVVKRLKSRMVKKYTINSIEVGNEYSFNKLLGLKQYPKK